MSYILGDVPFRRVLIRREFTAGLERHHGAFIKGYVHAVRCVRGQSLAFQVNLGDPFGGAMWTLPIDAIAWKQCARPESTKTLQPWDCSSSTFGVHEMAFMRRAGVEILPDRTKGQYWCTIDFIGSDLAEDFEQHKALHLVRREDGLIGAYPNNRLLWHDPAFWAVLTERPDFEALDWESGAEGFQDVFRRVPAVEPVPASSGLWRAPNGTGGKDWHEINVRGEITA